MFKNKKQLLYRFLKENKLFTNNVVKNNIMKTQVINNLSVNVFDISICWSSTSEGYKFWLTTQCDFILFVLKYDINNIFEKDRVQLTLHSMIKRCKNESKFDKSYEKLIELYSQYLEN